MYTAAEAAQDAYDELTGRFEETQIVYLFCPCGEEWTSEAFEGELEEPDCPECATEGARL